MWLTTEGVYGIALGVSTSTIFVYVLFGALLDRAGGGNYMMQVSFAALGHLRGGPAKVAVVSSALNGMISGSSVSNVVSGGIFTIPLMKKAGYGGVKAGAIETMSSVNGQIMPPVMGAAAFLMVEYVGIPYSDVVKHAFLPATLSYIGLLYIVHLEALKLGMQPIVGAWRGRWRRPAAALRPGASGSVVVVGALYYLLQFFKARWAPPRPGRSARSCWPVPGGSCARRRQPRPAGGHRRRPPARAGNLAHGARRPALPDAHRHADLVPDGRGDVARAVGVLGDRRADRADADAAAADRTGCAASARAAAPGARAGTPWCTAHDGARNMIGIGVATATAGIIVGGITLTGLGLRMTEFVEFVSQGNVIAMLLFIAFVCLVLGMGVPTTANYVLVATLMAPVVVELGAQSGLVIPLIAVHLFVFYYGIMGDITPPVGLATFAAAAISGEDAIQTGIQGALYALRTVILPFIWIFNPQLLLIDVHGWGELLLVVSACTLAMLGFAALTMNWLRVRMRLVGIRRCWRWRW
jgi:TRAP-type uncharacterized transport system fused permease subunit